MRSARVVRAISTSTVTVQRPDPDSYSRKGWPRVASWPFRKLAHEWRNLTRAISRSGGTAPNLPADSPPNLIISPGGVGTTFLIDHCGQFIATNDRDDLDGLKHIPRVPLAADQPPKVVFITGDPEEIYASISRRGWIRDQSSKLGCVICQFSWGAFRKRAFTARVDAQIAEFTQAADRGDVLLIAYDDIWDRAHEIARWLGIEDPAFLTNFPKRRSRTEAHRK